MAACEQTAPALRTSQEAADWAHKHLRGRREMFAVASIDARNRPLRFHKIAVGSLAAVMVHPREVFRCLVRDAAAAAILLHNHPSGDALPSQEDEHITARLVEAGRVLGIPILDHIIVGAGGRYFSMSDMGRMPPAGPTMRSGAPS